MGFKRDKKSTHKMSDKEYIKRCIELSEHAYAVGDMPFGCVIVRGEEIVCEAKNNAHTTGLVSDHAEMLAMMEAQKLLGTKNLTDCTFYSNFEPCPMCAFMMRELRFGRVVFSLLSKDMGGYSRWQILQDELLSEKFPLHFGPVPEIVTGVLADEAEKVWLRRKAEKAVL